MVVWVQDLKKCRSRPRGDGAVADVGLLCKVLRRRDWVVHPLNGEEGGQVRRVRRYHNERKEPPETGQGTPGYCPDITKYRDKNYMCAGLIIESPWKEITALLHP